MMSEDSQKYRWLSKYLPDKSKKRLVVLTGARQTGKTTLAKLIYPKISYVNLDSPENRAAIHNISSFSWGKDVGVAVLDEAQKEPSIFEKVKYCYDADEISFSVLLGSAQILLLKKVRESLAGRVFLYELWPLMLSELLSINNQESPAIPLLDKIIEAQSLAKTLAKEAKTLLPQNSLLKREAENYLLKWGGMPELLHLNNKDRSKWLKSYEYTYLERDLADLAKLNDLEAFRKFQQLTSLRSAKLLNYSELSKDAGISIDSARRYLEYLKLSYQTITLQPFYRNLTSSIIKTPKVYFTDIGILRQLAGFSGEINGELYETYVVSEVFKWIKTTQKEVEIYFYRTRSGLEIDLLLKTAGGIIGIEIKSGQKITRSDFSPMLAIADKLKSEWIGGMVVYRGNRLEKVSEQNIWTIPSYRLFS